MNDISIPGRSILQIVTFAVLLCVISCSKDSPTAPENLTLTKDGVILGNGCLVKILSGARSYSASGNCDGTSYDLNFNLITWYQNSLIGYTVTTGGKTLVYGKPEIRIISNPPAGNYGFPPLSIYLQTESIPVDVPIYFTTDNSDPNPNNGTIFHDPIVINKNTILKAMASSSSGIASSIVSFEYNISFRYISSIHVDGNPTSLAWDGNNLWYLSENKLVSVNELGTQVDQINLVNGEIAGFTWDGQNFWINHATGDLNNAKTSKIDRQGHIIKSITLGGWSMSTDLAWDGINLWGLRMMYGDMLIGADTTGALKGSYEISSMANYLWEYGLGGSEISSSIAWYNKKLWILYTALKESPNSSSKASDLPYLFNIDSKSSDIFRMVYLDNKSGSLKGFSDILGTKESNIQTRFGITFTTNNKLWISTPYYQKNLHQFEIIE